MVFDKLYICWHLYNRALSCMPVINNWNSQPHLRLPCPNKQHLNYVDYFSVAPVQGPSPADLLNGGTIDG